MNILFTCAGRRNYLINYFKDALNGNGLTIAADMDSTAPALVDSDLSIQVPSIYDKDYIEAISEIITKNNVKAVISLNDLELPILSANKSYLEDSGAKVIVSSEPVIDICFDKLKTVEYLRSIGLDTPKSYLNINDAIKNIQNGNLSFPLVIKPRWGSASIGIDFPESLDELKLAYNLLKIKLTRTILSNVSATDIDNAIIIQEKLPGKEYGMDILNDFSGNYFGSFAREKLAMRSGETDKALSIVNDDFEKLGRKIGTSLGHIGNLDCDVFEKDGKLYVLELNPRFGGGYPFSHESGINTAAIYIEWLKGNTNVEHLNQYKPGIIFSKCDRLIRVN